MGTFSNAVLRDLLDRYDKGRVESESVEFKRSWSEVLGKGQNAEGLNNRDRLRRIVAGMANRHHTTEPGYIIFGAKKGKLYDSPLPLDESDVQQWLKDIEPVPTVRIHTPMLDGNQFVVLEVVAPFDRPYVARIKDKRIVFFRQGSNTEQIATRRVFDDWYAANVSEPTLNLLFRTEDEEGDDVDLEHLPYRPAVPREALVASLRDRLRQLRALSMPTAAYGAEVVARFRARLDSFAVDIDRFERALADDDAYFAFIMKSTSYEPTAVQLAFENNGEAVATGPKAWIELPGWLRATKSLKILRGENSPLKAPIEPAVPRPPLSIARRRELQHTADGFQPVGMPHLKSLFEPASIFPAAANRSSESDADSEEIAVRFAGSLSHGGGFRCAHEQVFLFALDTAPATTQLRGEHFCLEWKGRRSISVEARAIQDGSSIRSNDAE